MRPLIPADLVIFKVARALKVEVSNPLEAAEVVLAQNTCPEKITPAEFDWAQKAAQRITRGIS